MKIQKTIEKSNNCISCNNITVAYGENLAVCDVTTEFVEGDSTAIIGPNGSGKSTMIKAIIGQLPLKQGSIDWESNSTNFAYLPQASLIDRQFPINVWDMVSLGTWAVSGAFRDLNSQMLCRAKEAIEAVGLSDFIKCQISELSSGQFQRVLFARLILQNSSVIILDEPFTGIDARTTSDLLSLINIWQNEKRTIIAVLHDLEQVRDNFSRAVLLNGCLVASGTVDEVLTPRNLQVFKTGFIEDETA